MPRQNYFICLKICMYIFENAFKLIHEYFYSEKQKSTHGNRTTWNGLKEKKEKKPVWQQHSHRDTEPEENYLFI